jgi:predicted ATPase
MTEQKPTTLHELRLAHFKRFAQQTFPLRALTLLCGLNGSGKSTLIQALLLGMSGLQAGPAGFVALNHPWLPLGMADDVFTFGESSSEIALGLTFSDRVDWSLTLQRQSDPLRLTVQTSLTHQELQKRFTTLKGRPWFAYLSAERLGPRIQLPLATHGEGSVFVGSQGELTADCLYTNSQHQVAERRRHPASQSEEEELITLPKQTERWMAEFVPGLQIQALRSTDTLQSTFRFRIGAQESVRPTNMGFGVSYALPIVVQGLLMAPGEILIVENPEAHLHPAGQSAMGRFLGLCAADGVQVIVETHSDHVLHGICLAALEDRHPLRREDVLIHHFLMEPQAGQLVLAIELDRRGGFTSNPPGFFDQSAKDLQAILAARRPEAQVAKKLRDQAEARQRAEGDGQDG